MSASSSLHVPAAGRGKRLPAPERRAQILAAARDIFIAEGIERASMRRIATAVGITPTAIYDHFADKQALLRAIANEFFEGLLVSLDAIDQGTSPLAASSHDTMARLRAMLRAYVRHGLAHPHAYRLILMSPLSILSHKPSHRPHREMCLLAEEGARPAVPQEVTKGMQSFTLLEQEIGRLMELGLLREASKEAMADSVWAAVHGIVSLKINHDAFCFTPLDIWLETALDIVLSGLRHSDHTAPP
jgi:AcrR family transcriptional regulator